MQPGLSDVANDVDADPGAVLEANGAESVDDLVTAESEPEQDAASRRAVSRLFEEELDRPERRPTPRHEQGDGAGTPPRESADVPAVLAELERAIEAGEDGRTDDDPANIEALDDADVADALAAAAALDDDELPASVPEEWREE